LKVSMLCSNMSWKKPRSALPFFMISQRCAWWPPKTMKPSAS